MEWIKLALAAVVLLVYPLLPGSLLGYLRQRRKAKGLQQNRYLLGVLVYGALFAMLAFLGVYKNISFLWFSRIALFCSLGLAGAVAVCMGVWKGYREYVFEGFGIFRRITGQRFRWKPGRPELTVMAAYVLVALVYVLRPFPLETGFDTPERVVTLLQTGMLSGTNPLTGEVTGAAGGIPSLKECLENLPLFYACLCRWFSVSPTKLLFGVIPFVNLFLIFQVMDSFACCFWDRRTEQQPVFLLFFALLTLCGNKAYMNTSYGILHFPYEGMTLFSGAILPLGFVACFRGVTCLRDVDGGVLLLLMVNSVFLAGFEKGFWIFLIEVIVLLVSRLIFNLWRRRSPLWK